MRRRLGWMLLGALLLLPWTTGDDFLGNTAGRRAATDATEIRLDETALRNEPSPGLVENLRSLGQHDALFESVEALRLGGTIRGPESEDFRYRGPKSQRYLRLLESSGVLERSAEPLETAGVAHYDYQLKKQGVPVFNRSGRLHESEGELIDHTGYTGLPKLAKGGWVLSSADARMRAQEVVEVEVPRGITLAERGWFAHGAESIPAWQVTVPSRVPLATWRVMLDARDGKVLEKTNLLLSAAGSGEVFDPNPKDASRPSLVELRNLDGTGTLSGTYTQVFDLLEPAAYVPTLNFLFPPDDPRFAQTSVYWGLTRAARLAQKYGFPDFKAPVPAYTNLLQFNGSELNNAFYDSSGPEFVFGNGDGFVLQNIPIDSDVAIHEMGHHLFQTLAKPRSLGFPIASMHEGFADTWAMLVNQDPRIGESVVPGAKQLRRIDGKNKFPDDIASSPHQTGLIYAGANWDLRKKVGNKKLGQILMAGLPFLARDAGLYEYSRVLLKGDKQITKGKNKDAIKKILAKRGFETPKFQFLSDGIQESGTVPDKDFHFYIYSPPPGATKVEFKLSGSGDAALAVIGPDSDPDRPNTFLWSDRAGSSKEKIIVTRSTQPSVDEELAVVVQDYPDKQKSSYKLKSRSWLGSASSGLGRTSYQAISSPGEVDFITFNAVEGQYVRVDVSASFAGLDLLAAVLEPREFDILAIDDDSGPGLDPLMQGVRIPKTGLYAVAVLALFDDFDPYFPLGAYQVHLSECVNSGTDADNDGIADRCDDDDDADGFSDGIDSDPLDADVCDDIDLDGCDDCSRGSFDPRNDGHDSDGDGECDLTDVDDDNDGCWDFEDPDPDSPSVDPDLDFWGADCDNCPLVPNLYQRDFDLDGIGDACSSCALLEWSDPPSQVADQNPNNLYMSFPFPQDKGKQGFVALGDFNVAAGSPEPDPSVDGVHVLLEDDRGVLYDVNLPGGLRGSSACHADDGWLVTNDAGVTVWEYQNVSNSTDPFCTAGSAGGIQRVLIEDLRDTSVGALRYKVVSKNQTLHHAPSANPGFLRFSLALGQQDDPRTMSDAAATGQCTEAVFSKARPALSCQKVIKTRTVKKKNGKKKKVKYIKRIDCQVGR